MELPTPPQAVAALAAFVRGRLAEMSGTIGPLLGRREDAAVVAASARQLAVVIVGAAAPFAPTSYARARLLRQMHASGLLSDEHLRQTRELLELAAAPDVTGAPR